MSLTASSIEDALKRIPSVATLKVGIAAIEGDVILEMPFHANIIGNPIMPAIHGGAICGFMLVSATAHIVAAKARLRLPRPFNVSIDYLRPALSERVFASVRLVRLGRRVAHVHVEAWQSDKDRLIALLRSNFMLDAG